MVDSSGARRWILRLTVSGHRNARGAPLRTNLRLGSADLVTLTRVRERALEFRRLARSSVQPRDRARGALPTFEEAARKVHEERLPTFRNATHGRPWISTLETHAFPLIGSRPVDAPGQPEVLACLSPIWTAKHETARRLAQRIKTVLDVARSKGLRKRGRTPSPRSGMPACCRRCAHGRPITMRCPEGRSPPSTPASGIARRRPRRP